MERVFNAVTKDNPKHGNVGSCRSCGVMSGLRCKRCGDFYCSEKCQNIDWPNHRYICFPMPPLVKKSELFKNDDVFPTKPTGVTEDNANELQQLHTTLKAFLQKLQHFELNRNDAPANPTNGSMNGDQTLASDSTVVNRPQQPFENDLKNRNDDTRDLINAQLNGSHASLNKSSSEDNATDEDLVTLCSFRTTNRCVIRNKNLENDSAFNAVVEQIDKYGRDAPPMDAIPKVDTYAITMKSKQYTRVKVLKVFNVDKIRVIFCEYGNVVTRKLSDLRVISQEIANLPEYIRTVQLNGVQVTQYNEKIFEFFKSFERKDYKIKYVHKNGNTYAELYDIETDELLNDVVKKVCTENSSGDTNTAVAAATTAAKEPQFSPRPIHNKNERTSSSSIASEGSARKSGSTTIEPERKNAIGRVFEPPFKTKLFHVGMGGIEVVVVDTNLVEYGYLACIHRRDMIHLMNIQNFLNKMEFGDEPYEPKLGEYCVAQYENEWYRGLVVGEFKSGVDFEISYIDFLNEATLTSEHIRSYPKDLKIDCYTTLCKIDGLPKKLTDKHRAFLKSNIKINDVIAIDRVIEIIDEKVALVECSEIIAKINDMISM